MMEILAELETLYQQREAEIEAWLGARRDEYAPFVYNSVDLRHSGVRLVPVDNNLYPAGFHHLSPAAEARAARYLRRYLEERFPPARRVLIVPENHTRNLAYLDNLLALSRIVRSAGMQVQIGSLAGGAALVSRAGGEVVQHGLARQDGLLCTDQGFVPDVVLLNNDCTAGIPALLQGVVQPVIPPAERGWFARRKSGHFLSYARLAEAFAAAFGLDAWRIGAYFHGCGRVDFKQQSGLDCVAKAVDAIIARARIKHREYDIADDPYVFVKADGGTYGMGIMTVHSGSEMMEMNKKARNKMQTVKDGTRVARVIVQEGVPTIDKVGGAPAEPMIYLIDGVPAGGMYRVNAQRDAQDNLNTAGMEFTGMCDEAETPDITRQRVEACHFRAFGLIAALSGLAAAQESILHGGNDGSDCSDEGQTTGSV